jgi:hypothetical protein
VVSPFGRRFGTQWSLRFSDDACETGNSPTLVRFLSIRRGG